MSENPLNISFNRGNVYIYLLNIAKNLRLFAPQTTIESSWAHHVHCARGDGSARGYCRLQVATCRSKSRQYPHISPYISTKSPKISTRFSEKPSHPRHTHRRAHTHTHTAQSAAVDESEDTRAHTHCTVHSNKDLIAHAAAGLTPHRHSSS